MKVGDLVKHIPSGTAGLIVGFRERYGYGLMVQWCDDIGEVEYVGSYEGELEIISESR